LYRAEREIAERLRALAVGNPPWPQIDAEKAIPWVEKRTKLALAESQKEAIQVALASKVLLITGGPGVGKTTLINSLLKILLAKAVVIALCAPTGRAAKRLSESTGLEAKTIRRLLETDPKTGSFRRNEENALDCDLLVVDEPQWSTSRLCALCYGRCRTELHYCWWGMSTSCLRSGRAKCWRTS
jgi:exodeoxyribonuclease V alpha subunit